MFGLNDSNSPADANNLKPADSAQVTPSPSNPFGSQDSPVPAPNQTSQGDLALPASPAMPQVAPSPQKVVEPISALPVGDSNDLLDLKQQALQNLQPLVSHLEQSPEEKFKTTMMLIQASDNSALVKEAYQAANQITDEKARAQALLDVVNEINYFTHKNGPQTEVKA